MKASAHHRGAAAFSLTSFGPFLLHLPFLYFLLLVPRVAGSPRTIHLPASDLNPPPPTSWYSGSRFLYTTSPGIFLVLNVPGTSFLQFYGHKRAGASLYGLCLGCSGIPEPIDGHSPSLSTGYELAPSCLFSLSINGPDVPPLEVYNLFDRRFNMFGEITFSHVEYTVEDQGTLTTLAGDYYSPADHIEAADNSTSSDPLSPCLSHFDWTKPRQDRTRPHRALFPRGSPATNAADPSSSSLSGKMDLLIGLIAALITIVVVIFIIAILYMLYLRRRERMLWLSTQPTPNTQGQNRAQVPMNKSTTLLSATETVGPDLPPKDLESLRYKDRYLISEQKNSVISNPTSSFSTGAYETKHRRDQTFTQIRSPQTDTITIASSGSRPKSRTTPPSTAPPGRPLPIPEVPPIPKSVYLPRDPQDGNTGAEATLLSPLAKRSQIESKVQRPQPARTQPEDPRIGDSRRRKDYIALEQAIPFHMRNQGSDGSASSSEGHPKLRQGPSHSHPLEVLPEPSPLLKATFPSSTKPGRRKDQESTVDGRRPQRTAASAMHKRPDNNLADMQARMRLLRESLANPQPDGITSPGAPGPIGRARSSDDIRQRIETNGNMRARALRESKSSPELESPEVKLGVSQSRASILRNRDGHVDESPSIESQPRTPEGLQPQQSPYFDRRLSIKLPEDPPDWLSPIPYILSLYQDTEVEAQRLPATLPTSLARAAYSSKETQQLAQAKPAPAAVPTTPVQRRMPQPPEPVLTSTKGNTARLPLPQPPSYKRAALSTQNLTVEPLAIAPLSPHRRALPKIPT